MDDDLAELIAELCTRAAMIMEDVVDSALTIGHAKPDERADRLLKLRQAADRIGKLLDAADALGG